MMRVHYGASEYDGTYVLANPRDHLNDDSARGQWYGIEGSVVHPLAARHLLTAGFEFHDDFVQRQLNFDDVSPRIVNQDSHNATERLAVFAQDEVTLSKRITLHVGLREDWYRSFGYETSPRLALVYDDGKATALKLLHGRAFRAPNDFELHYTGPVFEINPRLGPETIRTTELVLEQTIRPGVQLHASVYANAIDNLISLVDDPASGLFVFQNAGQSDALGSELGVELKRHDGPSGRLSYAWQRSREHATREPLTNSPRHMAKGGVSLALLRQAPHREPGWLVLEQPAHPERSRDRLRNGGEHDAAGRGIPRAVRALGERLQSLRRAILRSRLHGAPAGSHRPGRPQLPAEALVPVLTRAHSRHTRFPATGALILAVALVLAPRGGASTRDPLPEYPVKAAFLYHFVEFVEWPAASPLHPGTVTIGVLGSDPFGEVLDKTVFDKTAAGRTLAVRRFASIAELKPCDILFIGSSEMPHLQTILARLSGSPCSPWAKPITSRGAGG